MGLIVLTCLSALSVSAAEAKKNNPQTAAEQKAQADREAAELKAQIEQQKAALEKQAQEKAELEKQLQEKQALGQQLQTEQKKQEEAMQQQAAKQQSSAPEPSLNLPIRYYVYTALFSGLGYATGFLSRGPERDLRDPAKHPTQDKTLTLYREARYTGFVSKGFYGVSGAFGAYAAYKTQSSIREYITAKAQAQMAAREREAAQRLAQASSPEQRKSAEVTNTLLAPPADPSERLVMVPEPPPLQAGFFVGPSGEASLSLSMSF